MSFSRSPPPTAIGPRRSRAGGLPALVAHPTGEAVLSRPAGRGGKLQLKLAAESVV